MKNYTIIAGIIIIGTTISGWYYYHHRAQPSFSRSTSSPAASQENHRQDSELGNMKHQAQALTGLSLMLKSFFDNAPKQLPTIISEIQKLEKAGVTEKPKAQNQIVREETETGAIIHVRQEPDPIKDLKETLRSLNIVNIIVQRDISQLKNMSAEELQRNISIHISGEAVHNVPTDQGTITSAALEGDNALAIVLFHSLLDQTQQDKDATLAMLQVLFDKKLDPNTQAGVVYWIQPQNESHSYDYPALFSLVEIAGFKEAANKIREYQKLFKTAQAQHNIEAFDGFVYTPRDQL